MGACKPVAEGGMSCVIPGFLNQPHPTKTAASPTDKQKGAAFFKTPTTDSKCASRFITRPLDNLSPHFNTKTLKFVKSLCPFLDEKHAKEEYKA
ncbi:hypothetical protein NHP190002_00830 [Helicobacter ailurogastricus]|nr:hypothetical protein ASB7_11580 [Helicobacter ailurogastricus]GLH57402.1 hypothetical protein NHP214376_01890 [Helicobacter ailurogastricus]GLH58774.1 hypothetical protein NHP214377_00380 [Helicobacter ailurogastricus]GMB89406.1 hypothetical protein NHP190002_00830 [Helicobacter ailurogastricus]GMB90957.1 hypothetical protein NHP190009_01220 [Helicobacter ailurogastricus]